MLHDAQSQLLKEGTMNRSAQNRDREFRRRLLMLEVAGIPGYLLLGFGLVGYFDGNAAVLHPLLGNENIVMGMLAVGGALTLINLGLFTRLILERGRRQRAGG
jgi:hypothetical protein